jgi:hypothetical protein
MVIWGWFIIVLTTLPVSAPSVSGPQNLQHFTVSTRQAGADLLVRSIST